MSLQTPPFQSPVERFFGWLLVAVGGLMALLCGLCTLTFWGVGLYGALQQPNGTGFGVAAGIIGMVTVIGGLPTAAGAVLVWAGWRILHPRRPPRNPARTFD